MSTSGDAKLNSKQKVRDAARERAAADGWKGFVNLELGEAQKAEVKALALHPDDVWDELLDLVSSDYKLTVSYDGARSVWNVSITCRSTQDRNGGLTLTGRGGGFIAAAASVVYKHIHILNRDWSKSRTQTGMTFDPDDVG